LKPVCDIGKTPRDDAPDPASRRAHVSSRGPGNLIQDPAFESPFRTAGGRFGNDNLGLPEIKLKE
jgi:hypothetical protein